MNEKLDSIYNLCSINKSREAIDEIIDYFDGLLNDESYELCDSVLEEVNLDKLDDASIVSILGITFAAKHNLKLRDSFFNRAIIFINSRRGELGSKKLLEKYR